MFVNFGWVVVQEGDSPQVRSVDSDTQNKMKLKHKKIVLFGSTLVFSQQTVLCVCRMSLFDGGVTERLVEEHLRCRGFAMAIELRCPDPFFSVSLEKRCLHSIFVKNGQLSVFHKGGWVLLVMDNKMRFDVHIELSTHQAGLNWNLRKSGYPSTNLLKFQIDFSRPCCYHLLIHVIVRISFLFLDHKCD